MKKRIVSMICVLGCVFIASVSGIAQKIPVAVSIPPQKFFLQKIAHPYLTIMVMVQPGSSPATYEPKPSQLSALSNTVAYFTIGVPFEEVWVPKFSDSNPKLIIIPTHESINKDFLHHKKSSSDHIGPQTRKDPHIWLSPPLVRIMVQTICDACISIDPAHTQEYVQNYYQLCQEIVRMDSAIISSLKKRNSRSNRFMVYHPAWGYFARTYGLKQLPVETHGKEPSPKELLQLISQAKKIGLKTIFVQPQFSQKSATTLAKDINGKVITLNPLAENWADNLQNASKAIIQNLQ
jgi:zinc transport system substrate-binding protein